MKNIRGGPWLPIFVSLPALIATLAALWIRSAAAPDDGASTQREASIVQEHGSVYVRPSGRDDYLPAQIDTPLEAGDTVQTGVDGDCDITLDGGSLLHLDKGTEMNLASLGEGLSAFSISVGGVLGKIVGSNGQAANMEFHTPAAWGGLRGTEIGVEASGSASRFGVFDEGKFAVHQGDVEVLLAPRMELAAKQGEPLGRAGPMRELLRYEKRMAQVRRDRESIAKAWKAADPAKRRALRERLLAQRPLRQDKVAKLLRKARERMDSRLGSSRSSANSSRARPKPRPSRR